MLSTMESPKGSLRRRKEQKAIERALSQERQRLRALLHGASPEQIRDITYQLVEVAERKNSGTRRSTCV